MDTQHKLDLLYDLQCKQDAIRLHYEDLRKTLIPEEIKAALDDIDAEQKTALDSLASGIDELTAEVKADVLQAGGSVKGLYLHAIYAKGRVSWDTKSLDGYAVAHPELLALRKEGAPSVSLRKI